MRINEAKIISYLTSLGLISEDIIFREGNRWASVTYPGPFSIHIVYIDRKIKMGEASSKIICELIKKEFGYSNELMLFLFILFHEIGHCYIKSASNRIKNNPAKLRFLRLVYNFLKETNLENKDEWIMLTEQSYRRLKEERYCDLYAIKKMKELFEKERRLRQNEYQKSNGLQKSETL